MPVKITPGNPETMAALLEKGMNCSFSRMELLSVTESGEIHGYLSEDEIPLPSIGRYRKLLLFVGVEQLLTKADDGTYHEQFNFSSPACSAEDVEQKITTMLSHRPGEHMARYALIKREEGDCYVIEISVDCTRTQTLQRKIAGGQTPNEKPFRKTSATYDHGGLANGLASLLSARRHISPDAIELKVPREEVPAMLGMRSQNYELTKEAIAVFGNNGCVESAVYVRMPVDGLNEAGSLNKLTDRTSKNHAHPIKSGHPFFDAQELKPVRLGGTVFEVLEGLESLLADDVPSDQNFPRPFRNVAAVEALKEYVVNAFCHGQWKSGVDGTRDDKQSWWFGNSLAIVNAENRIEVINRKQTEIQYEGVRSLGSLFPGSMGPIHSILKDIGLAYGRNIGLQLARQRLFRAGAPSPIHIRDVEFFRAVMPFRNEFDTIYIDSELPKKQERVQLVYTVRLATVLRNLNENVVSSALKVTLDDAALMLTAAERLGLLKKQLTARQYVTHLQRKAGHGTYYPGSQPTYELVDEARARSYISTIENDLEGIRAPDGMSPSGVYALSQWAMGRLVKKDIKNLIVDIFRKEALFGDECDNLADDFYRQIERHRRALGDAY